MDIRYALRQLARSPGFAAVAILTLALGIGANTAVFTLFNAVDLQRLPVRNPGQLVFFHSTGRGSFGWTSMSSYSGCDTDQVGESVGCSFSYPNFDQFRREAKSFDGIFAEAGAAGAQTLIRGETQPVSPQIVSGEYFSTLGVRPFAGRMLVPADDLPGAEPVTVLSYSYWKNQLGGDPAIVGKTIALNGASFTIAGVAPKEFFGLQPVSIPDMWIAIHASSRLGEGRWSNLGPENTWLFVLGRLKPGVQDDSAAAELAVIFQQSLVHDLHASFKPGAQPGILLTSAARGLAGLRLQYSKPLQVLMTVVALVLLIACANIANLLLARASARRREIAVRLSLGASRMRLVRQLFTESVLLSVLSVAAALLFAVWATRALAAFMFSKSLGAVLDLHLSAFIFGFAASLGVLTALVFGLAPAFIGTRVAPALELKSGGGIAGSTHLLSRRSWLGRSLVAGETALALVLLVGAGLFLRTLINLETTDLGFQKQNLLTVTVSVKEGSHPDAEQATGALLQPRLAALPGVLSASWSSDLLLVGNLETTSFPLRGRKELGIIEASLLGVGPNFFETMGIPVLTGRSVSIEDCQPNTGVVWVNRTFVERYFKGGNPLGDHIPRGIRSLEIVGIVGDAKYESLRAEIKPTIYVSSPDANVFELRTSGNPEALANTVREAVNDAAPFLRVDNLVSEAAMIDRALSTERLMAKLSTAFSLLALALAAIGIYGVLAYSVARRTGEIAVRMSLGAMPRDVVRLILRDGLSLAAAGSVAGLLVSYGLTRLLAGFLYGVKPLDWLTFASATFALMAMAALACLLPARRAMQVEPVAALRFE